VASGIKLNPKVAEKVMLKAGLEPKEPYKNADTKWKCKCLKCGATVYPRYYTVKAGGGCIYCGFKKTAEKQRNSEDKVRKLMLKNDFEPQEPYKNSHTLWKCKCLKCGKIVFITYTNVRLGYSGRKQCCSKVAVIPETNAIKRFEKAGFTLQEKYTTSGKALLVKCNACNKKSRRSLQGLTRKGKYQKCIYCAGLKIDQKDAIKKMRQGGFEPIGPYKGAKVAWKSKCLKCGRQVSPSLASIRRGGGCKYCAGNQPIENKKAIQNMIKHGYKPYGKYKNSQTKWKSKHIKCGSIVYPTYAQILNGDGGCQTCAPWGIKLYVPSYIYLITHPLLNAHKIGIGNYKTLKKKDRLHRLIIKGWQPYRKWDFSTGKKAISAEQAIFKIIRKDKKIPIYLSSADMGKIGGHTETIDADRITLLELEKIIKQVIKGYRNNP
jgi:hypothetical protein